MSLVKTALVSGATGFIGRHLVSRLVSCGWEVHVLVRCSASPAVLGALRPIASLHEIDGTYEALTSALRDARPDVAIHLASRFLATHQASDVPGLVEANILFGGQFAEACAGMGVKYFINTGTAWQYCESESYNPASLYAATKEAFEKVLEYYTSTGQLQVITLYLFDTYGPDDTRPKLFNLLEAARRSGEVLDMSPGGQRIDLTHVADVASAFVLAAERVCSGQSAAPFERFAVSSPCDRRTLREVVDLYATVTGSRVRVNWGGRPYRAREVMEPWNAPLVLPGWRPRIGLADGLSQVYGAGGASVRPST